MNWFISRPQPQTDGPNTEPLTYVDVDPDYTPEPETDEPLTHYPQWEHDEDGWPIIPPSREPNSHPIWE